MASGPRRPVSTSHKVAGAKVAAAVAATSTAAQDPKSHSSLDAAHASPSPSTSTSPTSASTPTPSTPTSPPYAPPARSTRARTAFTPEPQLRRRVLSVPPNGSDPGFSPSSTASSPQSALVTPHLHAVDPPESDSDESARDVDAHTDTMLSGKMGMRGRNIEDIGDLEEQGLLMRREPSPPQGSSSVIDTGAAGTNTPRRPRTKEKEREKGDGVQYEKLQLETEEEKASGAGLKSKRDQQAFALLVVLYLLQGVPLGLTFGTLPFLLKPHLSYSALAVFALSTWPYSLKLLWSPIVDSWFVPEWGRRKSWIVPVQAVVGVALWIIGGRVEGWLAAPTIDIRFITMVFGSLIFAAATQDIAVDGWALTLLSPPNLSYASTAQTIGLGIGTALSFTVFLALNSVDFTNKYFRSTPGDLPLVQLGPYIRFWGAMYIVVTIWLIFFKKEDPVSADDPDLDVAKVYKVMWSIVRLKNIQSFLFILLISKFGFQVNESVTQLKLLEKGLSKEDLAVAVLLDFPAQMVVGWLAAKWSRPTPPTDEHRHPLSATSTRAAAAAGVLRVWVGAFWARLVMATIAATVVWAFPSGKISSSYFALVIATTLMTSLTNTVQFVGITAFHTQIADPLIGGTYMTLLNTVSNLGGTWPKPLILRAVDVLTVSHCTSTGTECTSEQGKALCAAANGQCLITRDGYYVMDAICVTLAATLLVIHILPTIKRLQSLPMSAWRVKIPA